MTTNKNELENYIVGWTSKHINSDGFLSNDTPDNLREAFLAGARFERERILKLLLEEVNNTGGGITRSGSEWFDWLEENLGK